MTKTIALITTGGTIASRFDTTHGDVRANTGGHELLSGLPDLPADIAVEVIDFCNVNSFALDIETSFRLAKKVGDMLTRPDVAGAVVTHGTDTLEESAFLADVVVGSQKPIVFTGAQRSADALDGDGPANIANSIHVVASEDAIGLGALICFDEEIHAARDGTKTHTSRVGTFQSAEHGKLGDVDQGRVILHRAPRLRAHVPADRIESRVDLIKLALGMDARFLRYAIESGAKGVVIEAFGRGNVTPDVLAGIREAIARNIPVIITSRLPQGRVQPIYGGGAGGRDVFDAGAIFAGDLSGIKARILLAVLLGAETDDAGIRAAFGVIAG